MIEFTFNNIKALFLIGAKFFKMKGIRSGYRVYKKPILIHYKSSDGKEEKRN